MSKKSEQGIFKGIPYRVIRRPVKYARLEFLTGELRLILPQGMDVQTLLEKKSRWIQEKYRFIQQSNKKAENLQLVIRNRDELKNLVKDYLREAETHFGVKISRFQIRYMRTKWGSCSSRGTITINSLVRFLPDKLIRYLVFHEVNHLMFWRHDRLFWQNLEKFYQNVREMEELLSLYWFKISGNRRR